MVKLKKYPRAVKRFGLFLTFLLLLSCGTKYYNVSRIEGREIGITESVGTNPNIEQFIKPYRDSVDKDMNVVLAYAPETLDKSGQWQSKIGNLMAYVTRQAGDSLFFLREHKHVNLCLLNFGGIRSIIPKGNVTKRTAFEIMPFENRLVVAELKGEQIVELVNYFIADKKAHPLAGASFVIAPDGTAKYLAVTADGFDIDKNYYVVTSDYLVNGGDKMDFFKKAVNTYDLNYKLRDVLIDYFTAVDTVRPTINVGIIQSP